jgi:hypothetical protein
MNGVDNMNQNISYYAYERKTKKWWKKIFNFILEISINNAYILY